MVWLVEELESYSLNSCLNMRVLEIIKYYYYKMFKPEFFSGCKHGKNFRSNSLIDGLFPQLIEIGDNFISAPGSRILSHDASLLHHIGKMRAEKTIIGNNVFLGADSLIMPGVVIGNNVIIGAGSIVTKDIEDNSVVAGNPAKYICSVQEYIERCKHKQCLYDLSTSFKDAICNSKPVTIDITQSLRDTVYSQNNKFFQ